ncbi:hypothetical protein [Geothrix sp. 21YS21S-2]|uniref:hypothetical protein n=1 Tax=Geothrix sp. 21YS21S-2 TaxID=3068893 RepID=UPI0027BA09AA|nr:hypothetical protein [Geothrix sp. 21YS21S-2]
MNSLQRSSARTGFPPVLAAKVLRMLDDIRTLESVEEAGTHAFRKASRELLGRYPEVVSALHARGLGDRLRAGGAPV